MQQKEIPLWLLARWACLGFAFGILLHGAAPLIAMPAWIPTALVVGGIVCWRFRLFGIFLFCCALGLLRFDQTLPNDRSPFGPFVGVNVTMSVRVEEIGKYDAILSVKEIEGRVARVSSKLSLSSSGRSLRIGESWSVSCRLERNERTERKQEIYDARRGIFYRCRGTVAAHRTAEASSFNLKAVLASWRSKMTRRINQLIPGDEGALLAGILYGERGLSAQENAAFRMAGMTHLIAVSGSNISIVVGLFVPLFLFFGYGRKTAILFSGAAVFLFAIFVGAGASVIRAALMGWFAILARVFGRRADAHHLLLVVGSIMIALDPWALGFDAGFALSFLATWGLLVPGQVIAKRLTFIPEAMGLREAFATTLAASLATAPYQLWAFGSVSLLGLMTNLIAIPLTAFTMAWGAIAFALGGIVPYVELPAKGMLSSMLLIAGVAERFPFFVVEYRLPLIGLLCVMGMGFSVFSLHSAKNRIYPQIKGVMGNRYLCFDVFVRRASDTHIAGLNKFEEPDRDKKMSR